jgi:hypothetical protein
MTISSEVRKAGPFAGNDVTTSFPFVFKVFTSGDLEVVRADEDGIETILTQGTDYSVNLNANQNTNPGGTVVLTSPLVVDTTLVLTSRVQNLQPTDLTNQGGFYPKVINDALDRATIQIQQLVEQVDRSAKLPITSAADADSLVADIVLLANNNANINAVAENMDAVVAAPAQASAAATSAGQAATSATNAANSATAAATSASASSTSAGQAATSATSAATSATNAATSATNAASSATAAAGSATAAASSAAGVNLPSAAGQALNMLRQNSGATGFEYRTPEQVRQDIGASQTSAGFGQFRKANPDVVAFSKTGNFTVSTATQLFVEVNGVVRTIASATAVTMPSATTGTDYAIWCRPDGTLEATSNHTSPPVANSRKIGGFHYAPGGNAAAQSGGNTTAQINEFSFWDLKWRPNCPDPRGMTLVAGGFWMDIYLTGVDAITNGSSKFNVVMADGSSPPKVPTMFGGNGSTTYGSYTWFEAMELATAFGKRCPTQQEFMSAMYGTTEASSVGTDQGSTILNAAYTSRWGVIQSTGVLWIWARDRGGPFAGASWNANTEGRGSEFNAPNSALFGGSWLDGALSGSRCSFWANAASASNSAFGSRFVCDHLQLD